jgi:hypothetical protein
MHCEHKAVDWIQQGQILLSTMLQIKPTLFSKKKQQKGYKMCIHNEHKKSHQLCSFTGAKGKFSCIGNVNDVLNLRHVKWWYIGKTNTMKIM